MQHGLTENDVAFFTTMIGCEMYDDHVRSMRVIPETPTKKDFYCSTNIHEVRYALIRHLCDTRSGCVVVLCTYKTFAEALCNDLKKRSKTNE